MATLSLLVWGVMPSSLLRAQAVDYPPARTDTTSEIFFDTRVPSPYAWMADTSSAEVQSWVKAQRELADGYLGAIPLHPVLDARIRTLSDLKTVGFPKRSGSKIYYSVVERAGAPLVIYAQDDDGSPTVPLLDAADRWPDGSKQLIGYRASPDGHYLVYQMTDAATGEHAFHVLDLTTGADLPDVVRGVDRFSSYSWSKDSRGFVYDRPGPSGNAGPPTVDDDAYYHTLGTPQADDRLLFNMHEDPTRYVGTGITASGRYVILNLWDTAGGTNMLSYVDLGDPLHPNLEAPVQPLLTRDDGAYVWLREVNDQLYVQTTKDAPNGRIVAVPMGAGPDPELVTIVPEGDDVISEATVVGDYVAVAYLEEKGTRIALFTLDGIPAGEVPLPGAGSASNIFSTKEKPEVVYQFTSVTYPATWFRYDIEARTTTAIDPPAALRDADQYETRSAVATSADGTRIPVTITTRKGLSLDGSHPTALTTYGAFGATLTPRFSAGVAAWLERGGVYAEAHVRGGGKNGEAWHQAATGKNKQKSVDDFLAAAAYLVDAGYARPERLVALGSQVGGLVVGAALTQHPERFAAAYLRGPLVDMLRYDRSSPGSGWVSEFGSPTDAEAFPNLRALSPTEHVRPDVCYPAVLTAVADPAPQFPPVWQAYAFVAHLQAAQACDRPILLRARLHGTEDTAERNADAWTFLARQTGITATKAAAEDG